MKHARADYNQRVQDSANIIPQDEPVFLLRAKDPVAAETVRFWIRQQRKLLRTATLTPEERKKASKALDLAVAHAHAMDDWPTKGIIATA